MVSSRASTGKAYLAELPPDRRAVVEAVRAVILENLGPGYEEGMMYGMIGYYVPHRLYPAGYHVDPRQPLGLAALAAQKRYYSLYLGGLPIPSGSSASGPGPGRSSTWGSPASGSGSSRTWPSRSSGKPSRAFP